MELLLLTLTSYVIVMQNLSYCFIIVYDSRFPSFFISSHGNNCSSVFASVWSEICESLFPPLRQRM